jgi:hypothetical protein
MPEHRRDGKGQDGGASRGAAPALCPAWHPVWIEGSLRPLRQGHTAQRGNRGHFALRDRAAAQHARKRPSPNRTPVAAAHALIYSHIIRIDSERDGMPPPNSWLIAAGGGGSGGFKISAGGDSP